MGSRSRRAVWCCWLDALRRYWMCCVQWVSILLFSCRHLIHFPSKLTSGRGVWCWWYVLNLTNRHDVRTLVLLKLEVHAPSNAPHRRELIQFRILLVRPPAEGQPSSLSETLARARARCDASLMHPAAAAASPKEVWSTFRAISLPASLPAFILGCRCRQFAVLQFVRSLYVRSEHKLHSGSDDEEMWWNCA